MGTDDAVSHPTLPVALAVSKRGRWCVVGKVVPLDGVPVLAVAWRSQQGTAAVISLPLTVLDFAEQQGCRDIVWRRDRTPLEMRRLPLETVRTQGWLQGDGEIYVPLGAMKPVPWRRWAFAERVVHLGPGADETPSISAQPTLPGVA